MKSIKDFTLGAFYLVSGIYSFGFSMALVGVTKPLSGTTAYIPVPDGLFPLEVPLFALFGLVFIGASFYHFRMSFRPVSERQAEYGSQALIQ